MKKLLAIVSIVIIILAGTTAYQLSKKDKYNLVLEIDKDKPLKESLSTYLCLTIHFLNFI